MKVCTTFGKRWQDDIKFCPDDGSTLRSEGDTGDLIGTVIADRYHIRERLGEGGLRAVYLNEHTKVGLKLAITVSSFCLVSPGVEDAE